MEAGIPITEAMERTSITHVGTLTSARNMMEPKVTAIPAEINAIH